MARKKKVKKHQAEVSIVIPDSIWNTVSEKKKPRQRRKKAVEKEDSGKQSFIERKEKKPSPKKASTLSKIEIKPLSWLQEEIEKRIQAAKKVKGFKVEFLLSFKKEDSVYRVSILKTLEIFSKSGYDVWAQVSILSEEKLQYRISIEWNERL